MCISSVTRVVTCTTESAECTDGRVVRLIGVTNVSPGDYLEVYADVVIGKVTASNAQAIVSMRRKKGKRTT